MAANGIGVPAVILLSGTGVTSTPNVSGNNSGLNQYATYNATLSLSGTNTVSVTMTSVDLAGTSQSLTNASIVGVSYNTNVATLGSFTAGAATVTGVAKGQAVIDFQYPTFGGTIPAGNTSNIGGGTTYARLIVTVNS